MQQRHIHVGGAELDDLAPSPPAGPRYGARRPGSQTGVCIGDAARAAAGLTTDHPTTLYDPAARSIQHHGMDGGVGTDDGYTMPIVDTINMHTDGFAACRDFAA